MQDRAETGVVLATMAVALVTLGLNGLLSAAVIVAYGINYIAAASTLLMWVYSIFWAFSISRLLSARLYRNQALGLGLVAAGWAALNYSFLLQDNTVSELAFTLAALLTFYWADASVLASRKSDPLYRDAMHWRELRLVLWPMTILAVIAEYAGVVLDPSVYVVIASSGLSTSASATGAYLLLTIFLLGFVPGSVYLVAAARRSRDRTFRKHLEWFGAFGAFLFTLLLTAVATSQPLLIGVGYIGGTYCLYRSAKSLAPINHLPS